MTTEERYEEIYKKASEDKDYSNALAATERLAELEKEEKK